MKIPWVLNRFERFNFFSPLRLCVILSPVVDSIDVFIDLGEILALADCSFVQRMSVLFCAIRAGESSQGD